MYLDDYLYICIYTYLDRQSCRFFFATFEFHITLVLFPWYNIYYDHCHLDISLSHSGYPSTNHHHRPATAAIFSVVQWYSCWLPGWLPGWLAGLLACLLAGSLALLACWLAGLLACWLAGLLALLAGPLACLLAGLLAWFARWLPCLLACLLPCFPGTPVCENLAGKKKSPGRGKQIPRKKRVPPITTPSPSQQQRYIGLCHVDSLFPLRIHSFPLHEHICAPSWELACDLWCDVTSADSNH